MKVKRDDRRGFAGLSIRHEWRELPLFGSYDCRPAQDWVAILDLRRFHTAILVDRDAQFYPPGQLHLPRDRRVTRSHLLDDGLFCFNLRDGYVRSRADPAKESDDNE